MKFIILAFVAFIAAGCNLNTLNIEGTAEGVSEATVTLRGRAETLTGTNIKDGKFIIKQIKLEYPDYGLLTFSQPGKPDIDFEVYLESGDYEIAFGKDQLGAYPQIKTSSDIQNQLSAYYKIYDATSRQTVQNVEIFDAAYQSALGKLMGDWPDSVTGLSNKAEAERAKLRDMKRVALLSYVNKYPDNQIAIHLMQGMKFDEDPKAYHQLYQKLSATQKNSEEGKDIEQRINALLNLSRGAKAPAIEGLTPEGKPFDITKMGKKLVLVEFWRASSMNSRINHQTMKQNPPPFMKNKDVGIVSVSFDKKRDWWLGSMRDDKVTWPQVSDLKGNDSPNKTNWAISITPTYYLLNDEGKIVEPDLQFNEISMVVERYFSKTKQ